MLILGATADDKGAQLEFLIRQALETQGYVRVRGNVVRAGGNELDVTAERESPLLGGSVVTPLMCEAKAYADPVNMPSWQRFLGKLLIERSKAPSTIGMLVALNGVNGNVSGSYADLAENDASLFVFQGSDLEPAARGAGALAELADVLALTEEQFLRSPLQAEVAYHGGLHYWVVRWPGSEQYSVVDARGMMLPSQEVDRLRPALEATVSGELLGTDEARAEMQARHNSRLAAMGRLFGSGVRGSLSLTGKDAEVAEVLAAEPFCEVKAGIVRLKEPRDLDATAASRLIRSMFEDVVKVRRLGFMKDHGHDPYVLRLIELLPELQAGFTVKGEDLETLQAIAPQFPSVWMTLATQIEMITTHRAKQIAHAEDVESGALVGDAAEESDRHSFWEAIIRAVESDYSNERLRGFLYDYMEIAELQTTIEFVVKGKRGPLGKPVITQYRNAVRQFTDESWSEQPPEPIYILVRLLPSVEQPWDSEHSEPEFPLDGD